MTVYASVRPELRPFEVTQLIASFDVVAAKSITLRLLHPLPPPKNVVVASNSILFKRSFCFIFFNDED